jgi:hypothetical protein
MYPNATLSQTITKIFAEFLSTAESVAAGLPSEDLAPRVVPTMMDIEPASLALHITADADKAGNAMSEYKLEIALAVPLDSLTPEVAEGYIDAAIHRIYSDAFTTWMDDLDPEDATGWQFASGIRLVERLKVASIDERGTRAFAAIFSFDLAHNR